MRAILTLSVAFAALATLASPAAASSIVVPIDHSQRLSVQGEAASVVVGNPQVADVTVVDSHTVFVSGRGYGDTDVVILDHAGRTLYSGDVVVAAAGPGRVSVYRGPARTDLACAPGCSISVRSPTTPSVGGSSSGGGGSSAPGGSNPLGGLASGIGSAVSGGAHAVGNAIGAATSSAAPTAPS